MSSVFGKNIKIAIFGQSHAEVVGVCIDGLPAGEHIDKEALADFMARRAPGNASFATKRKEKDAVEILTGLVDDTTCGAPLMAMIRNTDCKSKDYSQFKDTPRPSHADYVAEIKYNGFQDIRGGGHFSGRLTAALCIAGGICKQLLEKKGIEIFSHIYTIGDITEPLFEQIAPEKNMLEKLARSHFPVLNENIGQKMIAKITEVQADCDSIGGGIECMVLGMPVGVGGGMFAGIENHLSSAIFGVPAVKGIEFGNGFSCMHLKGSENNDAFCMTDKEVKTASNRHGGILGGISSGMPIIFRTAIKATPSIAKSQKTVSLSEKKDTHIEIKGRHDPCIVPRAVACIEAATAIALYDLLLTSKI